MFKFMGMALLLIGVSQFSFGAFQVTAPEIDASSAVTAITLLSGGLLVLRGRRRH